MNATEEKKTFEVKKVANHQRKRVSRTIHHSATAVIENYAPSDKEKAASQVSIKAGYHPAGYGIYHQYTKIEPTGIENEYLVNWATADSCD